MTREIWEFFAVSWSDSPELSSHPELAMDYHTAQCNKLWYQFQTLDVEDFCRCKHETESSGNQSLKPIPAGSEAFSDYDSEQEECTQYKIVAKIKSKGNESKTAKYWNLKRDLHKAVPRSGKSVTRKLTIVAKSLKFINKRVLTKQIWPMRTYVN